ncbi:MAG: hypothetical protein HQK51_13830 [Oligoflexia bacterium]|nr:hypothetical protein [Oligoflexia bacterium]
MCTCKYCNILYAPRPQVKNPQACDRNECQLARQKDNEKTWRERNKAHYGKDYHEQMRGERDNIIQEVVMDVLKCLEIGKNFLEKTINLKDLNLDEFQKALTHFFSELGIRRVKKLLIL